MATLVSLLARLSEAERRNDEREARIRAEFERRTGHPRGVAVVGPDAQVWWELQGADPPGHDAADALVDEAVSAYLAADGPGREALLAAFDTARYVRWRAGWVAGAARDRMLASRAGGDEPREWLRRALAAISVECAITDYRDTIVALDALYIGAHRAGVDPAPFFADAATAAASASGERNRAARLLAMYAAPDRAAALAKAAASGRADDAGPSGS